MVTIEIPTQLLKFTAEQRECKLSAVTLKEAIDALIIQFPLLLDFLVDARGNYLLHVVFFIDGKQYNRQQAPESLLLQPDSRISILLALSGG